MDIIIPLGGKGERFSKENYAEPKPLVSVLDQPLISHLLDRLCKWTRDTDMIYIVYSPMLEGHNFREIMNARYGDRVSLVRLEKDYTSGATETVALGMQSIMHSRSHDIPDRPCVLLDGDAFYTIDILPMVRSSVFNGHGAIISFIEQGPGELNAYGPFSYLQVSLDGTITNIVEKRRVTRNAVCGLYAFTSGKDLITYCNKALSSGNSISGEYYTSCVVQSMINDGHIFDNVPINNENFVCLGTPEQLREYTNRVRGYLFDMDGTLVLTDHIYTSVWNEILQSLNLNVTYDFFVKHIQGKDDATAMASIAPCVQKSFLDNVSDLKDTLFIKHIVDIDIVPGAVEFILKVSSAGHRIAIVTNCNRKVAEAIIDKLGISSVVDVVIIGNECTRSKPAPDPYVTAAKAVGIPCEQCIAFEDSGTGLESAIAAKIPHIVGISTHMTQEQLQDKGATYTMSSFVDESPSDVFSKKIEGNLYINMLRAAILKCASRHVSDLVAVIFNEAQRMAGGYIADVIPVTLQTYDGKYIQCVAKVKPPSGDASVLGTMADALDLHNRERYFYESIADHVNISVPVYLGTIFDDDSKKAQGILLKNLSLPGFQLALNLNKEHIDVTLSIVESLARMHSGFWGKDIPAAFPGLMRNDHSRFRPAWGNFVQEKWPVFHDRYKHALSPECISLGSVIFRHFHDIQDKLSKGPLTLCHGDVKTGNIFYEKRDTGYTPHFLDWQYVSIGKGVQDLAFFLIESFEPATVTSYSTVAKDYYYKKLIDLNIRDYPREQFESDFKLACCYFPFFVAIWFGTLPHGADIPDGNFPALFCQRLFSFLIKHGVTGEAFENFMRQ